MARGFRVWAIAVTAPPLILACAGMTDGRDECCGKHRVLLQARRRFAPHTPSPSLPAQAGNPVCSMGGGSDVPTGRSALLPPLSPLFAKYKPLPAMIG